MHLSQEKGVDLRFSHLTVYKDLMYVIEATCLGCISFKLLEPSKSTSLALGR